MSRADRRSGSRGRVAVRIALVEGCVAMRDGGGPENPSPIFGPAEWRAFVLDARTGEFDLTRPSPAAPSRARGPGSPGPRRDVPWRHVLPPPPQRRHTRGPGLRRPGHGPG
ncbi:DUF397 domain-containing protein [Streptomyces sp. NBC_01498]|uniref:DUF397 domain-containing protein n=1 Tax=Streptomyces sp. NBC_01498 TaxID=2975870 RepID=UPI003FCD2216